MVGNECEINRADGGWWSIDEQRDGQTRVGNQLTRLTNRMRAAIYAKQTAQAAQTKRRLSEVFNNDHKSQSSLVAALKRYAEDRDLNILCGHLNSVLRTRQQRAVLQHIRFVLYGTFSFILTHRQGAVLQHIRFVLYDTSSFILTRQQRAVLQHIRFVVYDTSSFIFTRQRRTVLQHIRFVLYDTSCFILTRQQRAVLQHIRFVLYDTSSSIFTRQQRAVLQHIRLLIPPAQRSLFDDHINSGQVSINPEWDADPMVSEASPPPDMGHQTRTQIRHSGQRKLIQVVREAGSFGFVVKSSCPAYIESVDNGGPAQAAGLKDGDILLKLNGIDVRKVEHDRLIQLLQDSGSAPTLEIMRGGDGNAPSVTPSVSRASSGSWSSSSHDSADDILHSPLVKDTDGQSFTDKVV
ncbi:Na(+)/h(+) exchange regulatory cofactor nhe-rf3 [Plakobranchus ocellatus]|uniref:Na(+)/h(+) exchange regulatory cofactor nhe-rf3 n=1 Tax=Plakobranchus ocellatus TaxID=259542 RepID=A0AAV4CMW4_9GAST|nr:Na(+)/h(+) exchange regulatory cofactor nhe-rf3 [Plakobranchus ocellatus]